jgi:predicted ATP-dependent serine protease
MSEQYVCPQCGGETPELHEGSCEVCWQHNQLAQDLYNAQYDYWRSLDNERREELIRGQGE